MNGFSSSFEFPPRIRWQGKRETNTVTLTLEAAATQGRPERLYVWFSCYYAGRHYHGDEALEYAWLIYQHLPPGGPAHSPTPWNGLKSIKKCPYCNKSPLRTIHGFIHHLDEKPLWIVSPIMEAGNGRVLFSFTKICFQSRSINVTDNYLFQ